MTRLLPILLCLAFFSGACGRLEKIPERHGTSDRKADLEAKIMAVRAALPTEANGWPVSDDCDQVLWAGLLKASGSPVDLAPAEKAPGVLGRRWDRDCWDNADLGSKSTTSQDMALGWLWGQWAARDLEAVRRFADYGERNPVLVDGMPAWVIGAPYPAMASRVVWRPNGVGLVGRMLYALSGGAIEKAYRHLPSVYQAREGEEPYEGHLATLGITLSGEVDEAGSGTAFSLGINGEQRARLEGLTVKYPEDWTHAAAYAVYTGDYERALGLLLSDTACPLYAPDAPYCQVSWLFAAHLVLKRI